MEDDALHDLCRNLKSQLLGMYHTGITGAKASAWEVELAWVQRERDARRQMYDSWRAYYQAERRLDEEAARREEMLDAEAPPYYNDPCPGLN